MRGRAAVVALPALVVLALVAIVAVAATGTTPSGSSASRPPSDSLLDTLFSLFLVAVVAGGVLLLYGLTQRKAIAREVASGRYRRTSLVAFLAFIGLFTVVSYWRLSHWKAPQGRPEEGVFIGGQSGPKLEQTPGTNYEPSISWLSVAVVVALVAGAAVAYVFAERRARTSRASDDALAEQLALVLDDTLDDLRAEADPRRAIIAAYARLERVLAANGIARRPAETSEEYLQRVLTGLALHSGAVQRLTALFTQAKFSHHDVDATMKEDAIDALEQVRDELRGARTDASVPVELSVPSAGSTP
jgi:Domain of unknown function (DUF4129)